MKVATSQKWTSVNAVSVKKAQPKVFFPSIDALRMLCFLIVFLVHAHETLWRSGREEKLYGVLSFVLRNGDLVVNLFFLISGFLITFLLLKERERTGTVHLKHFYYRRILRVWPLFYLTLFIGFVVTPLLKSFVGQPVSEDANLWYYIFFINNFDLIRQWPGFPDALILIVLWTTAVEEQFYLVWPLMKYVNRKRLPLLFIVIIAVTLLFRSSYLSNNLYDHTVLRFHTLAVVSDMAWGALLAYYCSYDNAVFRLIKTLTKPQILAIYIATLVCVLFRTEIFDSGAGRLMERLVIAFFFGAIVVEQNFAQRSFFKFSQLKTITRMGQYTYGFYCLHFFFISIAYVAMQKLAPVQNLTAALCATAAALLFTIIAGILSFRYFEQPFMRLKDKFAYIKK